MDIETRIIAVANINQTMTTDDTDKNKGNNNIDNKERPALLHANDAGNNEGNNDFDINIDTKLTMMGGKTNFSIKAHTLR